MVVVVRGGINYDIPGPVEFRAPGGCHTKCGGADPGGAGATPHDPPSREAVVDPPRGITELDFSSGRIVLWALYEDQSPRADGG